MKSKSTLLCTVIGGLILLQFQTLYGTAPPPAADYQIVLSWAAFETELEGILVIPNPQTGVSYPLPGSVPGSAPDQSVQSSGDAPPSPETGRQTFRIRKFHPGTYQLWVKNPFIEEGFGGEEFVGDAAAEFKNSNATVNVYDHNQLVKQIIISPNPHGIVWHALDIDGATQQVMEINKFYTRLRAIFGRVIDAVSSDSLPEALIIVKNRDTRETVQRAISDKQGKFIIPVDLGRYVVYIGKDQYIPQGFEVDVLHDFPHTVHAVLTKIIPPQNYRIILTWDRFPVDVDAHLKGPHPGHEDFHIYWNRKTTIKGKKFLDRDDTHSYGPETITIHGLDPGTYTYIVHNYSGRNTTGGDALSQGNVRVNLYNGDRLLKEYRMPPGTPGTYWRVFQINGETGAIRDINQTGFESNPDNL